MAMNLLAIFTLGLGLGLGATASDIPFEPSPTEQTTCAEPVGQASRPALPPASWLDCTSLYSDWLYGGKKGVFRVTPGGLALGPDEDYAPLITHGTCTLGISLASSGNGHGKGVQLGDENVEAIIFYAMINNSTGTELSAHGTVECDKADELGSAALGWSFYDNTESA